uniref:Integrase core domain-containing protein n=1 Tax=Coccolithus braarudii TaxID=221442 RepID=A0A7S0L790_9EUKA|mmetsp:Transcript_23930/g.51606  ORF Transcript_23930/g.51606 Transcript_23930/m.51606 type:complete len:310 (+) Transcript_23930:181-1110(+)
MQQLGGQAVGKERVKASLFRVDPAASAARNGCVRKRMRRRVYHTDYYGQALHIDLNCKLFFGGRDSLCKLYTFGAIDGDSHFLLGLQPMLVKNAHVTYKAFLDALCVDNFMAHDTYVFDHGTEFVIVKDALRSQLGENVVKSTRSVHNQRIERAWGEFGMQVRDTIAAAVYSMLDDNVAKLDNDDDQLAMLYTIFMTTRAGCAWFTLVYNGHNVRGPGGGVPSTRRLLRSRPSTRAPQLMFDQSRSHGEGEEMTFQEEGFQVVEHRLLTMRAAGWDVPTGEEAWSSAQTQPLAPRMRLLYAHVADCMDH